MKNKEEFIEQLVKNKLMRTYEETALYEEAVNNLFDKTDSSCITKLINGFQDSTDNEEVMFSTLHGIEYFTNTLGLEKYIEIVIPLLKQLQEDAYNWSETIYLRLLNNEKAFNILLKKVTDLQDTDKQLVRSITENLINRNPNKFKSNGKKILITLS